MNKTAWAKAALIRAIRTVAQAAVATIGTTTLINEVNWPVVFSTAALAGILSILTSLITGLPEADDGTENKEDGSNDQ